MDTILIDRQVPAASNVLQTVGQNYRVGLLVGGEFDVDSALYSLAQVCGFLDSQAEAKFGGFSILALFEVHFQIIVSAVDRRTI